jgi:hypothetical protein
VPGQHRETEERYFRTGAQLREALPVIYAELRTAFIRDNGAFRYAAVENAVRWKLSEHDLDLLDALQRLDETGAAPHSAYATLDRWPRPETGRSERDAQLSLLALWDGSSGCHLIVNYEGVFDDDVQAFGQTMRRTLSHYGRAEPYESPQLDSPGTAPRSWWDRPVVVGVVAAALGSGVTYALQKLFG